MSRASMLAWFALVTGVEGCAGRPAEDPAGADPAACDHVIEDDLVAFEPPEPAPIATVSVAAMDRPTVTAVANGGLLPVEARMLVLSADGHEPELDAIRSVLDHRGVPYDVFVANAEPPLTASQLRAGDRGLYQATILASASLTIGSASALAAAEWAALADYEVTFGVRRAVLSAWPDPALGFGASTQVNTSTSALGVQCTAAGQAVFRDVNCGATQELRGGIAHLTTPPSSAPLVPLLADGAGHALAVVREGSDGRESLLLLFRNDPTRLHSLLFLHGVLGWVSGGTYLGEHRVVLSAQLDDMFLASSMWSGGTYRLDEHDLQAGRAWLNARRAQPITPDFRVAFAFNATRADEGDPLTEEALLQAGEWDWISHTYDHLLLDSLGYAAGSQQFVQNQQAAAALPLPGFDLRNLVTPAVSGLVNADVMRAASDAGIRFAVTDTSRAGCDNPSPNTAFYNVIAPSILLIPRRPTSLYYNVSTPAEWVAEYNALHPTLASTYAEVIDRQSDKLLTYLLRGDADPWMFHQANLRAYDGTHSTVSDLVDATLAKLAMRSRRPVRTPPMEDLGLRFARRMDYDRAGVRATLFRGRALVIDVARAARIPITGVRAADGESYGGDLLDLVDAVPGTSTCVPLDDAGQGCSPAPVREGGPGPALPATLGYCNASNAAQPIDAGTTSPADAGMIDAGMIDAGLIDAGMIDAGMIDAGTIDAGMIDAAVTIDAGTIDAGMIDARIDAGMIDAGTIDAAMIDGTIDAAMIDARVPDAMIDAFTLDAVAVDAAALPDAGTVVVDGGTGAGPDAPGSLDAGRSPADPGDGCSTGPAGARSTTALLILVGLLMRRRRRCPTRAAG